MRGVAGDASAARTSPAAARDANPSARAILVSAASGMRLDWASASNAGPCARKSIDSRGRRTPERAPAAWRWRIEDERSMITNMDQDRGAAHAEFRQNSAEGRSAVWLF